MSSHDKSMTLDDILEEEEVDYESDTPLPNYDGPAPPARASRVEPNPFPESGAVTALTALRATPSLESGDITNPLDEHQELAVTAHDDARLRSQTYATQRARQDYVFTPLSVEERLREVSRQTLASWVTGPEAKTASEIAARQALRERYLTTQVVPLDEYRQRLDRQAHGASIPSMRTVPIVLYPGEDENENDTFFTTWLHRVRKLRSVFALRESGDLADIRLERKLYYEFSKLKAKVRLRSVYRSQYAGTPQARAYAATSAAGPSHNMASDPITPTPSSVKRSASPTDLAADAQKRQRQMGNPAVRESHIPMSSRTQDTPAISPSIGTGSRDDVAGESSPHGTAGSLAHRAAPGEVGVSATAFAELFRQVNGLVYEVQTLRDRSDRLENRLLSLDQGQQRLGGQLDVLMRFPQIMATPTASAQAPPNPHGTDPDKA